MNATTQAIGAVMGSDDIRVTTTGSSDELLVISSGETTLTLRPAVSDGEAPDDGRGRRTTGQRRVDVLRCIAATTEAGVPPSAGPTTLGLLRSASDRWPGTTAATRGGRPTPSTLTGYLTITDIADDRARAAAHTRSRDQTWEVISAVMGGGPDHVDEMGGQLELSRRPKRNHGRARSSA